MDERLLQICLASLVFHFAAQQTNRQKFNFLVGPCGSAGVKYTRGSIQYRAEDNLQGVVLILAVELGADNP